MDKEKEVKRLIISYNEYGILVSQLCEKIENDFKKPDTVIGIKRGGLAIALHLSHYFNCNLEVLDLNNLESFESYIINQQNKIFYIVDDICDSGETFNKVLKTIYTSKNWDYSNKIRCFAIHKKNRSDFGLDYYLKLIEDDIWVSYPWEKTNEEINKAYMIY